MTDKKRILIISSDTAVAEAFRGSAYEVCATPTLQTALEQQGPFDCTLVEAWLTDGSAAEAARVLKERKIAGRLITLMRAPRVCAIVLGQIIAEGELEETVHRAVSFVLQLEDGSVPESSIRLSDPGMIEDVQRRSSR